MAVYTTVQLPGDRTVPSLGLGTWHMGEQRGARAAEMAALRAGIEAGLTMIDTAEMYGSGGAEEVAGEAIAGARDRLFIVSKVLPHNASRRGTVSACEASLKRLKTERIDLYLLHWRGSHPLAETVAAFEALTAAGKIGAWGVSNFDIGDMAELAKVSGGCAANQVLYHLGSRGIEWKLLPEMQKRGIVTMAYCPLGQGDLVRDQTISALARKHGVASSAIALAWLLSKPQVMAIPKSSRADRVGEFAQALTVKLDAEDFAALDKTFPPPKRQKPLDIV
jgi:diketogulonate reductase-like aldo/keto reductase